ncbi:MAG: sulfatase-like hydrolase/transferase [Limisphaerales bacterium]
MNTKTILGVLLTLVFGLVPQTSANEPPTNIIFIFADDWGWGDLSCHGHPYVKTPNIDRLAKEGTDFHRFTVASGVCSPSRTAVMTGHFPARYNIDGHFAWVPSNAKRNMPDWLDPNAPLLSRFLKSGGYATAHFGKWHLANDMIPDAPFPSEYGFDEYGAFNCSGPQMYVHDDVKSAIPFIEKSQASGNPFFINLWIHEPHTPFHVDPKLQKHFAKLGEKDAIYAATLFHADLRIGQLLDALDRLNLAKDTLVIFSSDNGPARGAPDAPLTLGYDSATGLGYGIAAAKGVTGGRRAYKGALLEGGIGVPFIARWPGKIAADKVDKTSIFSAVDLLPTFCEIAGVKLPASYRPDGISQVATLKGKGTAIREKPLFWKTVAPWPARKTKPDHWVSYAVVSKNWKLVSNRDAKYVELYDLVADPLEKKDLKEKHPAKVTQLKKMLIQWQGTLPAKPTGNVFSNLRNPKKTK